MATTVHVRGFATEKQRDDNIETPGETLIHGTPHNGYVLGVRARTLKVLEDALSNAEKRDVYLTFLLEDSEGNLEATTNVQEAINHLTF
jgi:hypothetical protein